MKTTTNSGRICIAVLALVALFCATTVDATPITSDLVLWLDGQDVDGNNDGQVAGSVATWVDKSGNGNDAINSGASAPDLEIGVGPGGTDGVDFDGDDFLDSVAPISEDVTVIAVYTPDVVSGNGMLASAGVVGNWGAGMYGMGGGQVGYAKGEMYIASTKEGEVLGPVSVGTTYLFAYVFEFNAEDGGELILNGVSQGTEDSLTTATSPTTTRTRVGNYVASTAAGLDGDVMELLIYDRALSDEEENEVGCYLETKYGLDTPYELPKPGTLIYGK